MKTHTRSLPWTLALLLVLQACDSVETTHTFNDTKQYAEETFSYEFAASSETLLRLEAVNGSIDIVGNPAVQSIVISGTRRVGSNTYQDAKTSLDDLQVAATSFAGEVHVETQQPKRSNGRNYEVTYDITVPAQLMVSVRSINGPVSLKDTGGGSVSLINGSIKSEGPLPASGSFDLTTINGEITLKIPKTTSARLKATVVNGRVSTSDLPTSGSGSGSTRSLDVTMGSGSGRIVLSTTNGDIKVAGY